MVTVQTARLHFVTSSIRKGEYVMNASKFSQKVGQIIVLNFWTPMVLL